jgi:hypothetical protein
MVTQIIYPKYTMWVFIYTSLFALCSILYGTFLDHLATKYDRAFLKDGEEKNKSRLVFEICLELGATSVGVYVFRELISLVMQTYFDIEKKPDNFAAVIVAPVIFAQQPKLMEKIKTVYADIFRS